MEFDDNVFQKIIDLINTQVATIKRKIKKMKGTR